MRRDLLMLCRKIVAISKERWPAPKEVEEEAEPTFPTGANVALFKHWGEVMGKFHARDANPETDFCKPTCLSSN